MADRETVITHLQIIHTWAEFARKRDLQFFTPKHLENIAEWMDDALELLKEQNWVKCSDRMPEERETIFAKLKGTDKWNKFMFEKMSDDVRVVEVFEDGTRRVFHSYTMDGKWENERSSTIRKNSKITHWMPNPELPEA